MKKSLVDHYTKYVKQNLKQSDSIAGVIVKDEIVDNKLKFKISFVIKFLRVLFALTIENIQ